jgi:hypothetical protein
MARVSGREVSLELVRATDGTPIRDSDNALSLSVVTIKAEKNLNIQRALTERGIVADTEAFTIFYDLNPQLREVDPLQASGPIKLPRITVGRQPLKPDRRVRLTVDPGLRTDLNQHVDLLNNMLDQRSLAQIPQETAEQLRDLNRWYQHIERSFNHRTGPPLRHQTLVQLEREANLLVSIVLRALHDRTITEADATTIALIHDDVNVEMTKYGQVLGNTSPKPETLYQVTVIIKGGNPDFADRLRVYYTFAGLYRDPPTDPSIPIFWFKELGSGKIEELAVKNYKIWAAKDGDPGHPLTVAVPVAIRSNTGPPIKVDLSVLDGVP